MSDKTNEIPEEWINACYPEARKIWIGCRDEDGDFDTRDVAKALARAAYSADRWRKALIALVEAGDEIVPALRSDNASDFVNESDADGFIVVHSEAVQLIAEEE